MSDPGGYELVMPFVCVVSRGGTYDDEAFTAGWRLGIIDTQLSHGVDPGPTYVEPATCTQVDLIALRYGWVVTFTPYDEHWSLARFERKRRG